MLKFYFFLTLQGKLMKKEELKYEFIEMRALGYTYEKICGQLKITKPTAIKWGKSLSGEIAEQRRHLIAKIFSEKIFEQEQGVLIRMEQFRRKKNMNLKRSLSDKIDKKLLKGLEKIFLKKIKAMHLKMTDDAVTSALFIFDEDLKVEKRD